MLRDYEPPDEPVVISIVISFPEERAEVIVTDWPSAVLVMAPWLDRRGCMIRVSPDEDGNVWIQLRYQPTRQEVEFHCGLHEFAEEGR